MRQLPTGTLTLLFTDIEGSTRLLQQLGNQYAEMLGECRKVLRAAFQKWHGYEVDTQGDAFFVVFERAIDAILAAVASQKALSEASWPDGAIVHVRWVSIPESCNLQKKDILLAFARQPLHGEKEL